MQGENLPCHYGNYGQLLKCAVYLRQSSSTSVSSIYSDHSARCVCVFSGSF